MERAVGKNEKLEKLSWKVRNEIGTIEVGKFGPKLESSRRSWKVRAEVGKLGLKLENTTEVGKFKLNLENLNEVGKINRSWKIKLTFQLKTFQVLVLSNYTYPLPWILFDGKHVVRKSSWKNKKLGSDC